MPCHSFTIVLPELEDATAEAADLLFEAHCDDGHFYRQGGEVAIDFDREAPSYEEAVDTAKHDIRAAGFVPGEVRPIEDDETQWSITKEGAKG